MAHDAIVFGRIFSICICHTPCNGKLAQERCIKRIRAELALVLVDVTRRVAVLAIAMPLKERLGLKP